jgi:hypothetical protein
MRVQQLSVLLLFVAAALFFWLAFSGPAQQPVYSALGVAFLLIAVARIRRGARRRPPTA